MTTPLTYNGTADADYLSGTYDQANQINGLAGDDVISGLNLDDVLDGGEGNDSIGGGSGNDTLIGGLGNDTLGGDGGDDTYVFNQGDGIDTISDYGFDGTSTCDALQLGAGLTAASTQVARNDYDLVLNWGTADSVTLQNYFYSFSDYRVETIVFAEGITWDYAAIADQLTYNGTASADYMSGMTDQPNRINGLGGDDILEGGNLDDVLAGGEGNDTVRGGFGNDTYIFNQGDGADTIDDFDYIGRGDDTLQLGIGLTAADAQVVRNNHALVLNWGGGDSVTLQTYFYPYADGRIETISFADGSTWDYTAVASRATYEGTADADLMFGLTDQANRINGLAGDDSVLGDSLDDLLDGGEGNDYVGAGAGNDTLIGGLGNDTLSGDAGDDTYVFNQGDGADTISDFDFNAGSADVLAIGPGVTADQIWFRQVEWNLELSIIGTNDRVTIDNWFSDSAFHVEQIRTSDGHILLDTQVQALVSAMAAFAPPAEGQIALPADYQAALAPVIAANWV